MLTALPSTHASTTPDETDAETSSPPPRQAPPPFWGPRPPYARFPPGRPPIPLPMPPCPVTFFPTGLASPPHSAMLALNLAHPAVWALSLPSSP
mmetsp:Transcript_51854/g.103180  ORF Transcript_51854/g.103180 Transcript_51854/m.103180 type:complete len:94 (+) Transcript_51854:215-496(+)